MSESVSQRVEQGDAELITAVRSGDTAAFGELFERHRAAASRLARQLLPGTESEDLVSEAFIKVLAQLQAGKGPDLAFRAYLLTAIRRLHVDRYRSVQRERTTYDEAELDREVEFFDLAAAKFERGTASDAFSSLPERWQLVLWHLDVEGQKPADVAPLLGMSANSVSALAYRAREGLRQAYLQHHLADTATGDCRWTTERLGAHVRKGLSNRDTSRVETHLDDCRRCMGIYLELGEVNSNLAGIIGPAVLGAAASGYLAAGAGSAAVAAGGAIGLKAILIGGPKAAFESAKGVVAGSPGAVAGVVVATALVATGVLAATSGSNDKPEAKSPASKPASPAPAPGTDPPVEEDEATTEPTVEPSVEPTSEPATEQVVAPSSQAPQTPAPQPKPEPEPPNPPVETPDPPPAATDFGIGAITVDGPPLLRSVAIDVTARSGAPDSLPLTLTVDFKNLAVVPTVDGADWACQTRLISTVMTCTRTQSGLAVPDLRFRTLVTVGGGTVTIAAKGDPNAANNTSTFKVAGSS